MAIITPLDKQGLTQISINGNVKVPYLVENVIDLAAALAAKGSALVATDVIEALYIPPGTAVLGAGAAIVAPANSTTLTYTVGTGTDPDEWVMTLDGKAAVGTFGADVDAVPLWQTYAVADTVDLTLATLTGTLTAGKVRVYALFLDVTPAPGKVGIVQVGT